MSSSYRLSLENFLQTLDVKSDSVLDVGGAQLPLPKRVKSFETNNYKIMDLEDPHVGSPKPDIVFNLEEDVWAAEQYDLVFCLEVFDYIIDPINAMQNLRDMTKPGGTIWVTFPFLYPTHQPIEFEGLRYTENAVKRLAIKSDLEIIEIIRRKPETDAVDQLWRRERMRAAKNYDHDVLGWIVRLTK